MKQNIIFSPRHAAQSFFSSLALSGISQNVSMHIGGFSVQPAAHRLPQKGKFTQAVKQRLEETVDKFVALHPLVSSLCFAVAAPLGILFTVTLFTTLFVLPLGTLLGWL